MLRAASDCTTSTEEAGELRELFRGGLASELLAKDLRGLDDAREVRGAVERDADGTPLAGEGGEDRLPDPPNGVGDELHPLIGVELPGGGEEADVPLAMRSMRGARGSDTSWRRR